MLEQRVSGSGQEAPYMNGRASALLHQLRHHRLERLLSDRDHLLIGAVLNRVLDVDGGVGEAEGLRSCSDLP